MSDSNTIERLRERLAGKDEELLKANLKVEALRGRAEELEREVARLKGLAPKLFTVVEAMRRHTDPMGGASGRIVGQWADEIAAVRADMLPLT